MLNQSAVKIMGFKNPVGQISKSDDKSWKIVGVVNDFILNSPYSATEPLVILGPKGWFHIVNIKLNNNKPISTNLKMTEEIVKKYNPSYPFEYYFVDQVYSMKFNDEQKMGKIVGVFTGLNIFISCLGLFGLVTLTAEKRTKEISIRKVLGASVANIVTMLAKYFIRLVVISNLIAWPIAWWTMTEWLDNFSYRINLTVWVFILAALVALIITLITVSFKAIEVAIHAPVNSLRNE